MIPIYCFSAFRFNNICVPDLFNSCETEIISAEFISQESLRLCLERVDIDYS